MQTVAQLIYVDSDLLEQRSRYSLRLIEQGRKKMLIRNFLVIGLRSEILRRLERLLHFLREFIDAHASPSASARSASNALLAIGSCQQYSPLIAASSLPAYES
jgi:hypothetical protein